MELTFFLIRFSVDQGNTIQTCSLVENIAGATSSVHAERIYTEPTTTQTHFLLLTSFADINGKSSYSLFGFNFTTYFTRQCVGIEYPDKPASDYETFNPSGPSDSCILGLDVTYIRRKAGTACFVPQTEQVITQQRICNCSMADYVW